MLARVFSGGPGVGRASALLAEHCLPAASAAHSRRFAGTFFTKAEIKSPDFRAPKPAWKKVAVAMKAGPPGAAKGINAKYASKLEDRVQSKYCYTVEEVEAEVMGEMASSLQRADEKLAGLLRRLETARAAVVAAGGQRGGGDAAARRAAAGVFASARQAALEARAELVVHRQSVGFRCESGQAVDEVYPIPTVKEVLDSL